MPEPKKVIVYRDELHDDFADNNIRTKNVPSDFPFAVTNPFWVAAEFIVYRLIATPLVWLIAKLGFGLRIENRKVLRKLRHTGFYLYGNHTQTMMDAYTPTLCAFPHKAHVIVGPDAVSVPGIRSVVQMLGAIPLPSKAGGYPPFLAAQKLRLRQKRAIAIYPEAHIWPWYTGIRSFPDTSFAYPVSNHVPAVAYVTTYRRRRIFKKLWPLMTVTLSEPFWPDPTVPPKQARAALRRDVCEFMRQRTSLQDNYAYYEYRKASGDE